MKTILKLTSVLQIISGALSIITGVLLLAGGGLLGAASTNAAGDTQTAGVMLTGMALVLAAAVVAGGIFSLICGIFGLKGAKGNQGKLKAALVLGWISLVLCAVSAAGDIIGKADTQQMLSSILGIIIPLLFVISATSVKKENNK